MNKTSIIPALMELTDQWGRLLNQHFHQFSFSPPYEGTACLDCVY